MSNNVFVHIHFVSLIESLQLRGINTHY